jgi:hypothetical protein
MSILFLMLFYVLCFALDVAIIKHQRWLNHYKPGFRTGLIFSILVLPSFLIAIKISNQYFSETPLYLKVILSVIVILSFNSLMYRLMRKVVTLK